MAYNLYLSRNSTTSFLIVDEETINNTQTSIGFIGRRKTGYGETQDQSLLWMLEHFANSSAPNNPIVGQLWYDTAQSELKVYQLNGTWRKVSAPQASSSAPINPSDGQLWWDTINKVLKAWDAAGSVWIVIGPISVLSINSFQQFLLVSTTNDAVQTEMFINGVSNSRMVVPSGAVWMYDINVIGKRINSGAEAGGWKISGVISYLNGTTALIGEPSVTSWGYTSNWNVDVSADNSNHTLNVFSTGQAGKTITWNGIATLYKLS